MKFPKRGRVIPILQLQCGQKAAMFAAFFVITLSKFQVKHDCGAVVKVRRKEAVRYLRMVYQI